MFIGQFDHALDKKGRLVMPSRFRELFQEQYIEQFILTKWFDECLRLFPLPEWKILEKKWAALPQTDANARYVLRNIFSNAVDATIDRQGRIFVPIVLREKVGIEKSVVVIGLSNYIEIWAQSKWKQYHHDTARPFEEIAQALGV